MNRGKDDDVNQTFCLIATGGHLWMEDYYDRFSPRIRQRLRESRHNLCPACLELFVLPEVQARFPKYTRDAALLAAIVVMELRLEKQAP
jgi:hypothetical protein